MLLVDDHDFIRRAIRRILEQDQRFEICGEANNGAVAIDIAQKTTPDVVILNINMPVLNGFAAARRINSILPTAAIVMLSANADRQFVEEAKRIGAKAYVMKEKAGNALFEAVNVAIEGGDFLLVH